MRVAVVVAAAALTLTAAADGADAQVSVIDSIRAAPVDELGTDAIRFSSTPSLGGVATVVELQRTATGVAGRVRTFRGHPRSGWTQLTQRAVALSTERYRALATAIDAALARGIKEDSSGEIRVCSDGPGWLTERRVAGRSLRVSGFCGKDHPNARIARLIAEAAPVAPTLKDIEGLGPEIVGQLILSGRPHGIIQQVAQRPPAPLVPYGQVELLLFERPLAQEGGCTRKKWAAMFRLGPDRSIAEARFAEADAVTEVALTSGNGCAARPFTHVNPNMSATEALSALHALRKLLTTPLNPNIACLDRTASKLCTEPTALREKLAKMPVWAITRRGSVYALWLGISGESVTEVALDLSLPDEARVERKMPDPA